MKKIVLLPLLLLFLCSCDSNEEPIKGLSLSNTYTKVHLVYTNKCYSIVSWCNSYDNTYKIKFEDQTEIQVYKNNAMLINGVCPICGY